MCERIFLYPDIWFEIFKRVGLDVSSILILTNVCTAWHAMLRSNRGLELARVGIEMERRVLLIGRPNEKWLLSNASFASVLAGARSMSIYV